LSHEDTMKIVPYILLLTSCVLTTLSQISGTQYYRSTVIRGNHVTTNFGNWGVLAQPGDIRPHGAWMDTTNGYIGDESILIGLEFPIKDYTGDGIADTVHSVITSPVSRPALSRDENPGTGEPWTFMPESSSVNRPHIL
ncbi:MAG: hypothetical protein WCW40_12580, partial [Bacteroidota bacterium]